jgi:hypothetical protein
MCVSILKVACTGVRCIMSLHYNAFGIPQILEGIVGSVHI